MSTSERAHSKRAKWEETVREKLLARGVCQSTLTKFSSENLDADLEALYEVVLERCYDNRTAGEYNSKDEVIEEEKAMLRPRIQEDLIPRSECANHCLETPSLVIDDMDKFGSCSFCLQRVVDAANEDVGYFFFSNGGYEGEIKPHWVIDELIDMLQHESAESLREYIA